MKLSNLQQVIQINEKLKSLYGVHPVKNLPNFRLVYAGEQYEKRSGTFNVFIDGTDTFLRTETGIREVKKYAYLDDDLWLMERLISNDCPDVCEGDYIYSCFYSFKKIDHVPPLKAILFLMNMLLVVGGTAPKSEKEAYEREDKKLANQKIEARKILDEQFDYTEISLRLKHGAAVTDFNDKTGDVK